MSFVVAVPDLVEVAAQDLAGIRSALDQVTEAIVAPTTSLAPAAADEVSTAIAALFGTLGEEYQVLNAQVAAFHSAFVNALSGGAAAYIEAEIANGAALLQGGGNLAATVGGG
ncbi:PE family protein, partial [Mycobacterium malmoense]